MAALMCSKIHIQKGFTLMETLIATAIMLVSVAAIFALGGQTFQAAQQSEARFTAAFLAQEGIEIVRGVRDNNWLEDVAWDKGLDAGTYIADYKDQTLSAYSNTPLKKESNGFYQYDSGSDTSFSRKIEISDKTTNSFLVTVTVSWGDSQVQVKDKLWNWR